MRQIILLCGTLVLLSACQQPPLFREIPPEKSGIDFRNDLIESLELNIINVPYFYNGGGVAVGDFDNDGRKDLFFSGNMVDNQMYLNRGELHFEKITETAGVGAQGRWISGIALVDINEDGWLDLYACATMAGDPVNRTNLLYVNQGLNAEGIPTFEEQAGQYGIADSSYSSDAAFLDFDRDGDLDLYVITNSKIQGIPFTYRPKITDGSSVNTDKLYRNNGDGSFTEVSHEQGILTEGFGLGVSVFDVNKDGWADIYVGNDYLTNDLLYVNDGTGRFSNQIDQSIRHQSRFSMGNDAADINNDGHMEVITLDMAPEKNMRKKTVGSGSGYITYINDNRYGYTHQYVRNMLQLNNGDMTFSEIGQIAGVHQTEWSWSPLFADFDNDGLKDLVVTNGFPKDITDRDFISFRQESGAFASIEYLLGQIPSVKIPNYAYRNNGDLTFSDVSYEWGFRTPSFSNGAAFADLDNDGDLDYVVNNINDPAFLFENTLYQSGTERKHHYLRLSLKGPASNPFALGAKVSLFQADGTMQYCEQSLYRGYKSSVETDIHFGLGSAQTVTRLLVVWPDGKTTQLENVAADQTLVLDYTAASSLPPTDLQQNAAPLFQPANATLGINFRHTEVDFIDFNVQRTIPHKFSQAGPAIAVGDVNGDGREDFYLGGGRGHHLGAFIQQADGTFQHPVATDLQDREKMEEDQGILLFDADGDGDLDLYVVSGSYEHPKDSEFYQDRLYFNDGKGGFVFQPDALPKMRESGSCVRAADFDRDGDLDLFVGGRVVMGEYPRSPRSFLLQNDGGRFTDVTESLCPVLLQGGMISDGIWTDYDNDGKIDLMVAGEFMAIRLFHNTGTNFEEATNTGLSSYTGWWNSLAAGDFDRDGDMDYIAGNLGLNNMYCASETQPVRVIAKDVDDNGSIDAILSCYVLAEDGTMQSFPTHYWNELSAQSPRFRNQFDSYLAYSLTTMDQLLPPEDLADAIILEARWMKSSYLENLGNGQFAVHALPLEAQFAPVNGLQCIDLNQDGYLDVLMVGNDYGGETNSGQYDAFTGLVLLGDGQGHFRSVRSLESKFATNGDSKGLARMTGPQGQSYFLVTQNQGALLAYQSTQAAARVLPLQTLDAWAELTYEDGKVQRVELPYGTGFFSQSSRTLPIGAGVTAVRIVDYVGVERAVSVVLP